MSEHSSHPFEGYHQETFRAGKAVGVALSPEAFVGFCLGMSVMTEEFPELERLLGSSESWLDLAVEHEDKVEGVPDGPPP